MPNRRLKFKLSSQWRRVICWNELILVSKKKVKAIVALKINNDQNREKSLQKFSFFLEQISKEGTISKGKNSIEINIKIKKHKKYSTNGISNYEKVFDRADLNCFHRFMIPEHLPNMLLSKAYTNVFKNLIRISKLLL